MRSRMLVYFGCWSRAPLAAVSWILCRRGLTTPTSLDQSRGDLDACCCPGVALESQYLGVRPIQHSVKSYDGSPVLVLGDATGHTRDGGRVALHHG
jgi:hypothetical protein